MSCNTFFRLADTKQEPCGVVLDSDKYLSDKNMNRVLELFPIVSFIMPFWKDSNIQLDTVFECLNRIDEVRRIMELAEEKQKTHINIRYVNMDEEIEVVSIKGLKEILDYFEKYKKYISEDLNDNDMGVFKECLWEFVRRREAPDNESRLCSIPIYETVICAADVKNDIKSYKHTKICGLEINETRSLNKYDGNWYYSLGPRDIFNDYMRSAKKYWSGKISDNPRIEYQFSGKYSLKEFRFDNI